MHDPNDFPTPADADRITQETIEKYARYVNPAALNLLKLGGFDKVEWRGSGAAITDLHGKSYIDCLGGYGVFALGHAHPEIVAAVQAQAATLPLSSKTFLNKPLADLCERLAALAPGDLQYTFVSNSGTEAIEAALKFARAATKRTNFVAAHGAYHGKTFGALSASGRDVYKTPFAPLVPGFSHVPFGAFDALAGAVDADTAAVILEPVQGESGIRIPPRGYISHAREVCDKHGALLILDEVQTGIGRTGRMFACDYCKIAPDILVLAKALGGGVMPIGATMGTPAVWEAMFKNNPFLHTSTFGGSELACVAALETLKIVERDNLCAESERKGATLLGGLRGVQERYPDLLTGTRGVGLMIGVEFADADVGKLAIGALVKHGVVAAYTLNNAKIIRFEPPLVITDAQVQTVIAAFGCAVAETAELLAELLA